MAPLTFLPLRIEEISNICCKVNIFGIFLQIDSSAVVEMEIIDSDESDYEVDFNEDISTSAQTGKVVYALSQKMMPNIIDCNLKNDYPIFIFFCRNIPDATGPQSTIQIPTLPNVCFCTTWGKHNTRNRH